MLVLRDSLGNLALNGPAANRLSCVNDLLRKAGYLSENDTPGIRVESSHLHLGPARPRASRPVERGCFTVSDPNPMGECGVLGWARLSRKIEGAGSDTVESRGSIILA